MDFFIILIIVICCSPWAGIKTAFIIGVLWILFTSVKEGMNEGSSQYAWFEPEGYGTSHSMINPIIKPLMYKYTN